MDYFLADINYLVFKKYVLFKFPKSSYVENNERYISIINKEENFQVNFWKNKIIEFQKFTNNQIEYYLHFEFEKINKSKSLLEDFLSFTMKKQIKKIKILVVCTGGFTSLYFVEGLKKYIYEKIFDIKVDSSCYTKISELIDQYDLILLAPQVSYEASKYSEYPQIKIIPTNIYATYNYSKAIEFIFNKR